MKTIKIGVMPQEEIRARTVAIASGEYRPTPREPKIWFPSIRTLSQVLSDENQVLLKIILETEPQSISELTEKTGRKLSNLSRTLKTLAHYGLVTLIKKNNKVKPVAKTTQFNVVFGITFDKKEITSI